MDLSALFQAAPDIIQGAGTLMNLFTKRKASKEVPALNEMLNAVRGQQRYAEAAGNPNDPFFKNMVAINREQGMANLAGSLMQIMKAHARASARGAPGFFVNPERRDEAIASAFAREGQNVENDAKTRAAQYLMQTAQGLGQAAQGFQVPAGIQQQYSQVDQNRQAAIPGALAGLMRAGTDIYNRLSWPTTINTVFGAMPAPRYPGSSSYGINARLY